MLQVLVEIIGDISSLFADVKTENLRSQNEQKLQSVAALRSANLLDRETKTC